jgi:hypothetical protein
MLKAATAKGISLFTATELQPFFTTASPVKQATAKNSPAFRPLPTGQYPQLQA